MSRGGCGPHGSKKTESGPKGPVNNGKSGRGRAQKGGIFGIWFRLFMGFSGKKKENSIAGTNERWHHQGMSWAYTGLTVVRPGPQPGRPGPLTILSATSS